MKRAIWAMPAGFVAGLFFAHAAFAQTAPDQAPVQKRVPTAEASPTAAPAFGGLLGDFGNGDRSRLAKSGFTVNGHLVDEAAANSSGGLPLGGTAHQRGTALSSEFGFGFDLDFDKLYAGSGAGILHFLLTTRFGSNLSSQAIGNLASVKEIYGDGQTTRITFLDYEQPIFKKRLDLRLEKTISRTTSSRGRATGAAICTAFTRTTTSAARRPAYRSTTAWCRAAPRATRITHRPNGERGCASTRVATSTCRPRRFKAIRS